MIFLDKQAKRERLDICKACEHFQKKYRRCKKCGCIIEAKAGLYHARCPIGKW